MTAVEDRKQRTLLVVDDDEDIRYSLQQVLTLEGWDVRLASDGAQGLEILQQQPIHLILLDLMMPGMNGWEFREKQLADPGLAGIPVVIISGANLPAASLSSLRLDEYLKKPVELDELLAAVERLAKPR